MRKACAGKKVLIMGLPGAFTPTCSEKHVPSYVAAVDELLAGSSGLPVDRVVCTSVNDAWVMRAWQKDFESGGASDNAKKLLFLPDAHGRLGDALGVIVDKPDLGERRMTRFSAFVEDLTVTSVFLEPAPPGAKLRTGADFMLRHLAELGAKRRRT